MSSDLKQRIAARYGVRPNVPIARLINRAIRTLPGGHELLDAIEAANAARNHAQRAGASERIVAIDAAIDRLEDIRSAMERHVRESV